MGPRGGWFCRSHHRATTNTTTALHSTSRCTCRGLRFLPCSPGSVLDEAFVIPICPSSIYFQLLAFYPFLDSECLGWSPRHPTTLTVSPGYWRAIIQMFLNPGLIHARFNRIQSRGSPLLPGEPLQSDSRQRFYRILVDV